MRSSSAGGKRQGYGFPVRPLWAEVAIGVIGCGVVLGAVWVANSYPWPDATRAAPTSRPSGLSEVPVIGHRHRVSRSCSLWASPRS